MNGRLEKLFIVIATAWGVLRVLIMRPKIVVLGTDMIGAFAYDPRMSQVYQWLEAQNISFIHLVHITPHGRVVAHWFRRRHPVVYLEGLAYVRSSFLSWLLRRSGVRQLWAIDDYRTWPYVVAAALSAGVRSTLFQHGRFTRYQRYLALEEHPVGKVACPDAYIVWNTYWRDKLLNISPFFRNDPDVLRIGGKPSADTTFAHADPETGIGHLRVMVLHEPAAPSGEIRAFVDRLSELQDMDLVYKVRGDQSVQDQLLHHGLSETMSTNRWTVTSGLVHCDLVVGSYSTLMYEVIPAMIPVGVIQYSSTQADELVSDGLAAYVDPEAPDLTGELKQAASVPTDELNRRAERLAVTADIRDTLKELYFHGI